MVQLFYMDIIMHLIMVQILFFRLIQMVRHFPLNLNSFGIRGKHGIWSLGGETTVRMAAVVSLLLVFYAL